MANIAPHENILEDLEKEQAIKKIKITINNAQLVGVMITAPLKRGL
jgi:hypothetical protein